MHSFQDILEELIVYIHDGSDVEHDSFAVSVTDGVFTAVGQVNIIIGLMNDETPRVTVNRGLRVQMGESTVMLHFNLKEITLNMKLFDQIYQFL